MLIEFSVENFRSIRERVTLSMIAARLRARDAQLDHDNVVQVNAKLSLLRSAVIYGANASGKSNLIKAVGTMRRLIMESARNQDEDTLPIEPFLLNTSTIDAPSTFEIVFLLDKLQYRYGFSVTSKRVMSEWLYYIPTIREVELFTRDEEGIYPGNQFREGRGLQELNLDNKLFLSVVAQFKKEGIAHRVREWFAINCRTLNTSTDSGYLSYTIDCIHDGHYQKQMEALVHRFDPDITGLSVEETPLSLYAYHAYLTDHLLKESQNSSDRHPTSPQHTIPSMISNPTRKERPNVDLLNSSYQFAVASLTGSAANLTRKELRTHHAIRDAQGIAVKENEFSAQNLESDGTQKWIALLGPLLDVLTYGWVLFVDEIDARLHPLITAAILQLFNSPETNPRQAQLICATHDTNLLDRDRLRRDQIYFVEKDRTAASRLYSLADFKLEVPEGTQRTPRNDESFEKNYIQGRYGAIPYLGDISRLFAEELNVETGENVEGAQQEVEV